MAEKKAAKKSTKKSPNGTSESGKASRGFTPEERAAMREYAKERRGVGGKVDEENAVIEKIAAMPQPDRGKAERIHAIIKKIAPELAPRTWYGMPAYAKDGQVVCFFQDARKFKTRYATLGFSDKARLDEGNMWPNSYAVMELTAAEEARITELVKKAVGR